MEHLFLNKELSLLAKEKGFDEPCFMIHFNHGESWSLRYWGNIRAIYRNEDKISPVKNSWVSKFKDECIAAPLYQQIIDWFETNYSITPLIQYYKNFHDTYSWRGGYKKLGDNKQVFTNTQQLGQTKLMAWETAIEEAFKLI